MSELEQTVAAMLSNGKISIARTYNQIQVYLEGKKYAIVNDKPKITRYFGNTEDMNLLPILTKLIFDYTNHSLVLPANLSRVFTDNGYRFIGKDSYKYTFPDGNK